MCACRLEENLGSPDMEEKYYNIYDMVQDRNNSTDFEGENIDESDVFAQLAKKEKDLILAAELGKALLEKNDELQRANDHLQEEYNSKLEDLSQEKHALRRRLEVKESEYESKVMELASDVAALRRELDDTQGLLRQAERDRGTVVGELSEQNHRLTTQLKLTSAKEAELTIQLDALKETFKMKKSSIHEHVNQLECLREEITIVTEKKVELERRIELIEMEKENMSANLDEAQDRIVMLERQGKEQEQALRCQEREIEESREVNASLQERVNSLLGSSGQHTGNMSLYNELSITQMLRDTERFPGSQPSSAGSFIEPVEEEDIECDDEMSMTESHAMGYFARLPCQNDEDVYQLRQEVFDVYRQLKCLCGDVRRVCGVRTGSTQSLTHIQTTCIDDTQLVECEETESQQGTLPRSGYKTGTLSGVMKELQGLMTELVKCEICLCKPEQCVEMEAQIKHMTDEVSNTKSHLERIRYQMELRDEEIQKKSDELTKLTEKLSLQHERITQLTEDRDKVLDDASGGSLARDEVVRKAREERDEAVRRRNEAEMELARSRVDVMQMNGQLMEAIQQKLDLSQQLEQWETDMQQILAEQVHQKLSEQQNGSTHLNRINTSSTSDANQSWSAKLLANLPSLSSPQKHVGNQ